MHCRHPPTARTSPVRRRVAVCWATATGGDPVRTQYPPVSGLEASALAPFGAIWEKRVAKAHASTATRRADRAGGCPRDLIPRSLLSRPRTQQDHGRLLRSTGPEVA